MSGLRAFLPTIKQVKKLLNFTCNATRSFGTTVRRNGVFLSKSCQTTMRVNKDANTIRNQISLQPPNLQSNTTTTKRALISSISLNSNNSAIASSPNTDYNNNTNNNITYSNNRNRKNKNKNIIASKNITNRKLSTAATAATAAVHTVSTYTDSYDFNFFNNFSKRWYARSNVKKSDEIDYSAAGAASGMQPIPSQLARHGVFSNKQHKSRLFSYHSFSIPKPNHLKKGNFGKNELEFGYAGEDSYFCKILETSNTDGTNNSNNNNNNSDGSGKNRNNETIATIDADSDPRPPEFFDSFNPKRKYKSLVIGVADGVGNQKQTEQMRSATFAQELMRESLRFLGNVENDNSLIKASLDKFDNSYNDDENISNIEYKYNFGELTQMDGISQASLRHAMQEVIKNGFKGASTLCTVTLEFPQISQYSDTRYDPKLLHACNLGDSGFAIFRRGLAHKRDDLASIRKFAKRGGREVPKPPSDDENRENEFNNETESVDKELEMEDDMFEKELTFGEKIRKAFESDYEEPRIGMPALRPETDYFMLYRSPTQIQDFGVPYQFGSHSTSNTIKDAVNINGIELESGDIIVIGTDGLWDNLFSNDVANTVSDAMRHFDETNFLSGNSVHKYILDGNITHRLIKKAYENSQDHNCVTPWSLYMTDTVEMVYSGGKHDDITCSVVYIH